MKTVAVKRAAASLADAWQMGNLLNGLPEEIRPRTAADGYRIQAALAKALDVEIGGWKIGCTSDYAQKLLNAKGPFAGRILAPRLFASGSVLPGGAYKLRGLEGEFAFVLGRDLKPRKRPYTRAEVKAAVAELRPAIELVDSRFVDWKAVGTPCLIADMGCNAALVVGKPVARWRSLDLATAKARMKVDGEVVGEGVGGAALGDPLLALTWLANHLRHGEGLQAGQIVSTGTCTGFHQAAAKAEVTADFGKLGKVSLKLAA